MIFIAIFLASGVGVSLLVALAAWAGIERPRAPLDRARALALFDEDFPEKPIEALWIAYDGEGAIARSGQGALIAFRLGDGYVTRAAPWSVVENARRKEAGVQLRLGDITAPKALFKLPGSAPWPPRLEVVR